MILDCLLNKLKNLKKAKLSKDTYLEDSVYIKGVY